MEKIQKQLASHNVTINETTFDEYKESVVKALIRKPINRLDLLSKVWAEIAKGEYRFAREEDLAVEVKQMTIDHLMKYIDELLDAKSHRLLLLKTKSPQSTAFNGLNNLRSYDELKQKSATTYYTDEILS